MRRDVNTLCREIALDKFDPSVVVGISRGGLTPGVMMSHWFKIPFKPVKAALRDFPEWEDYLPKKSDRRILIVDDICDSGETFEKMREYLLENAGFSTLRSGIVNRANGFDIRFATLWWNNECNFEPHYYAQEIAKDSTNTWIHFCWENWWCPPI
jgi:hypoxanthine phosphoribosyltransferase